MAFKIVIYIFLFNVLGEGGFPLLLFDSKNISITLTPFNNFMATSLGFEDKQIKMGVMGSMKEILPEMRFSFILHVSDSINRGVAEWGKLMRKVYNKDEKYRAEDFTNNYLGYGTDTGQCYYYYNGTKGY